MRKPTLLSALAGGCEGWSVAYFGGVPEAEAALAGVGAERRHLWCSIWAQMAHRAERVDQPDDIDLWRERLKRGSERALLHQAGFVEAKGLRGAFRKFGWMALDEAQNYLVLADILSRDGAVAKAVRHLGELNGQAIGLLACIPPYACTSEAIERFRRDDRVTPDLLLRLTWRIERQRRLDPKVADWMQTKFVSLVIDAATGDDQSGLPFPPPPWVGQEGILPVDCEEKLRSVARRFLNCLGSRTSQVRLGLSYYFELDGIAVIEFERVSNLGWEITDARGPRNATLLPHEIAQLRSVMKRAPEWMSPVMPAHLYR